ncbi:MAG: VWA domain-containing protein [Pseudomonadota bacterium]|nr:VWA domain-containing protein [Pseudomonadota bacterium]
MLEAFHFIHPLWLLALLPLMLLAWRACQPGGDNPWRRIVDARLLPLLMVGQPVAKGSRRMLWLVGAGWLIATLALADPTWQRKPQPVFQTHAARVVVLDLSSSMNASDLKPSRLARARYKVQDVLSLGAEGQTGLVAYAGDAFTVTPLTRDVNTIRAQLDALAPDLMPSDGSRADLGLLKAEELLRHAGVSTGQVLLIADGVAPDAIAATERAAGRLKEDGYRVSVLDVGTEAGGPVPDAQGSLARDAQGQVVMARTDTAALRAIARAGGGVDLSVNDGIDALRGWVDTHGASQAAGTERSDLTAQGWKEEGPLLALLLLPLAALAFRRNWLLSALLLPMLVMQPHDAMASTWGDLWQRPDQQAARSLSAGDYAKAAQVATDAGRRGSAEYKRGNYQLALDDFSRAPGDEANYNRGNALARLGRYPDAISAYDKALKGDPGNDDARVNKAAVEALLKQQQKQQQKEQEKGQEKDQGGKDQQPSGREKSSQQGSSSKSEARQNGSGQSDGKNPSTGQKQGPSSSSATPGAGSQDAQGNTSRQTPPPTQENAESADSRDKEPASGASEKGSPAGAVAGRDSEPKNSADASGSSQKKPGNAFSEAAKQLGAQGAKGGSNGSEPAASGGRPAADGPSAGAKPRQGAADASSSAQPLPSEEQLAAEQWLRRIPDDPGGLLRRKFLYQYRQRAQPSADGTP